MTLHRKTLTAWLAGASLLAFAHTASAQSADARALALGNYREAVQQASQTIAEVETGYACKFVSIEMFNVAMSAIAAHLYSAANYNNIRLTTDPFPGIAHMAIGAGLENARNGACDHIGPADRERFRLWLNDFVRS